MLVEIGRSSGPCTDKPVEMEIAAGNIDLVKDVLAVVNRASSDKESWYVVIDGKMVIPVLRKG